MCGRRDLLHNRRLPLGLCRQAEAVDAGHCEAGQRWLPWFKMKLTLPPWLIQMLCASMQRVGHDATGSEAV